MKGCVVLVSAICVAGPLLGQDPLPGLARVSWLQGCWVSVSPERVVEENWTGARSGTMMGISRTLSGDSLAGYEVVILRERDTTLVYEAHPAEQAPAKFPAVHASDTGAVFENPMHDFPQRIGYSRVGRDSLFAYIEGWVSGRSRRMEFPYVRTPCEGAAPSAAAAAESASVTAFYREWFGSLHLGPDAYAGFYAVDGMLLPPNKPPAVGRAAIARWLREAQASLPYTVRPEGVTVDERSFLNPSWVLYRSTLRGQRIPIAGGAAVPFETKYFDLLHRTGAGRWEVVYRMWSDNR